MRIDDIPIGKNPPKDINVVIEIAIGGEPIKYEIDKKAGVLFVDRILQTEMRYPGNYGFIPQTLSDDGDPLDVLVVNHRPIISGAVINCRPIGVLHMTDESGKDEKILAVPVTKVSAVYKDVNSYKQLPEILLKRISHFFEHYKDLEEGKWVKVEKWGDYDDAERIIVEAIDRATKQK